MPIKVILILTAGLLFIVSLAGFLYAKICLRRQADAELEDCCHEFEDRLLGLARYNAWCRVTLTGVMIAMLLMFLALIL